MPIHKLSPAKVRTAKAGKYEDGGGLRLVVSTSGAKKWVLRFTLNGKRREMGLGSFPDVSLGEARDRAKDARQRVKEGKDPIETRQSEPVSIPTFTSCAARYIRAHRRGWKNPKHARQWVSTLKTYVRPVLGSSHVDTITTEQVLKALTPIWHAKSETAKRVQGRIENVLDYASAHNYRPSDNPGRWRGHLDKLLPNPSRVRKVRHHPAMPHADVPAFMAELTDNGSISALALQFLILTATRTNEVLGAPWSEVDLEAKVWTIPAERMKTGAKHEVPLTPPALRILKAVPRVADNPYVFPGSRSGRPLSNGALLELMKGMGYASSGVRGHYVPHGFRSSFRDWAGEVSSFPRDVAEMALAHALEDKVEAAYLRSQLFDKRRKMMNQWANYLTGSKGNVVQIRRSRK